MLHHTNIVTGKIRVQIHSKEEQTSCPLKGRTDFRRYRGKTGAKFWEEYILVPTDGRTGFGSYIGKNMFHITHRETQVSDPTERRRQFRSHSGKNNCTKQMLLGWIFRLMYKNIRYNPISFRDPGREIYFLIVTYFRRLYLFISNNYDMKKYLVNVSFKCLG